MSTSPKQVSLKIRLLSNNKNFPFMVLSKVLNIQMKGNITADYFEEQ